MPYTKDQIKTMLQTQNAEVCWPVDEDRQQQGGGSMSSLPPVTPLVQRYPDPYYQLGKYGEHYLMSDGIRSRHESAEEVYRIINQIKRNRLTFDPKAV